MGTAGARKTGEGTAPARPTGWFERELAELNAQLDDVAAWLATRPTSPPPPARGQVAGAAADEPAPSIGRGLHASAHPAEPAPALTAPAAESAAAPPPEPPPNPAAAPAPAAASAEPPLPTGTDLSDPKNFGLMPPTGDLEPGDCSPEEYRQRLGRDLAFATTVLHTSKVPAAIWREWRAFEKALHEKLRDL